MRETDYITGSRAAWLEMLRVCLKNLGYESTEAAKAAWVIEREEASLALRGVCAAFGDNVWDEKLHLADVIDKHLARHLYERNVALSLVSPSAKEEVTHDGVTLPDPGGPKIKSFEVLESYKD